MKQLALVSGIFLLFTIGLTNCKNISAGNISIDLSSLRVVSPINGPIEYKSNHAYANKDDAKIYFDDLPSGVSNLDVEWAKYLFKWVIPIFEKIHELDFEIRYQDNRLWGLTVLNNTDPDTVVHCSAFANVEVIPAPSNDLPPGFYLPLKKHYYIEARLYEGSAALLVDIYNVTAVVGMKRPDGEQMDMLKKVLPEIQGIFGLNQPVRYGQIIAFKVLVSKPGVGEFYQFTAILEKQSCHQDNAKSCPFVPIEDNIIKSAYIVLVTTDTVNESAKLDHLIQLTGG